MADVDKLHNTLQRLLDLQDIVMNHPVHKIETFFHSPEINPGAVLAFAEEDMTLIEEKIKKSIPGIKPSTLPAEKVGSTPGVYILINEKWEKYEGEHQDGDKDKEYSLHDILDSKGLDLESEVNLAFYGCHCKMEIGIIGTDGIVNPKPLELEMIEKQARIIGNIHSLDYQYVKLELKFK